jgi:hypothetical protein
MVSWVILSAEVSISVDRLHVLRQNVGAFSQLIDQGYQLPPALDYELGVGIEQVEELRFLGHQSREHWAPPLAKKTC